MLQFQIINKGHCIESIHFTCKEIDRITEFKLDHLLFNTNSTEMIHRSKVKHKMMHKMAFSTEKELLLYIVKMFKAGNRS